MTKSVVIFPVVFYSIAIGMLVTVLAAQQPPKNATLLPKAREAEFQAAREIVKGETECDFTIRVRGETGREEDTVQPLVDYLTRCGCDPVKWTHQNPTRSPNGNANDDAWWTVTGSFVQKDLPIVESPKLREKDELDVSNAISMGTKFPHGAHKVAIFDADDLNTGLVDRLLGPWYRPSQCRVTSNSIDGLCVLLGCQGESLKKLDAQTKTRIASALCNFHLAGGGDLFAGGNTRTKRK